jgi:hypothetical protein
MASISASSCSRVISKLRGGEEVERPAHRPQLHERALLPERLRDRLALEPLDSRVKGELGRRHHLGVQAADAGDDVEHLVARRPLQKVVAPHSPGERLRPAELDHHRTAS